jgi:hypothetical protein
MAIKVILANVQNVRLDTKAYVDSILGQQMNKSALKYYLTYGAHNIGLGVRPDILIFATNAF